jgi:hypothetical protein
MKNVYVKITTAKIELMATLKHWCLGSTVIRYKQRNCKLKFLVSSTAHKFIKKIS